MNHAPADGGRIIWNDDHSRVEINTTDDSTKNRLIPTPLPPRETRLAVRRAMVTGNRRFLGLLFDSGMACRIDLTTATSQTVEDVFPREANGSALSEDGRYWVVADWTVMVIYDALTGKIRRLPNDPQWTKDLDFSPDGRLLASAGISGRIEILSVPEFEIVTVLRGHLEEATFAEFTPDGRTLISSEIAEGLRFWSTDQWRQLLHVPVPDIYTFKIAPDGRSIALEIKPPDAATGTRLEIMEAPGE